MGGWSLFTQKMKTTVNGTLIGGHFALGLELGRIDISNKLVAKLESFYFDNKRREIETHTHTYKKSLMVGLATSIISQIIDRSDLISFAFLPIMNSLCNYTSINMFFSCISNLFDHGSINSMQSGYSLDVEFNSTSNKCLHLKFE